MTERRLSDRHDSAGGATNVPLAQIITAIFNEPMNATTIKTSTFTLTGTGGAAVNGTSVTPELRQHLCQAPL